LPEATELPDLNFGCACPKLFFPNTLAATNPKAKKDLILIHPSKALALWKPIFGSHPMIIDFRHSLEIDPTIPSIWSGVDVFF
jgi:hypothetical protein